MAATLQAAGRFLQLSGRNLTATQSRSAFIARKHDPSNPNWLRVGLAFGASAAIWAMIYKEHNDDIAEYERRKAERGL